jgi:tRNA U34 5-methylaminomethyl-2-thiouridine-forming methyltransferase MnmC
MKAETVEMENENLAIVTTQEGSHTLFNKSVKEHYHSLLGSLQESMHVFIRNGFCKVVPDKKEISILEMGFGTGLNAILTYRENQLYRRKVHYTGIDIQPLPMQMVNRLNYFEYFGKPLQPVFEKIHSADWFQWNRFENFNLLKIETDILDHRFDDHYDLIYYDAFSPGHQSNLWQAELFHKIYEASNKGAVLVAYCAKEDVRKTLEMVGFTAEILPGPEGKREMIRAIK